MNIDNYRVALIHDWYLTKSIAGAEKVTFQIDECLTKNFSKPDLFSISENLSKSKIDFFKGRNIETSFIQNLPFGNDNVQNYLPLIPFAIEQIDLKEYELIISSSHLAAKGVLSSPDQLHISYIHTPMRYAWDQMSIYLKKSKISRYGMEWFIRYFLFKLRQWDVYSSTRPDYLIANSTFTSRRIKKYWGLNSEIIYPPVNIKRFECNQTRENFYLTVSRLVPNKRVDILVHAFNNLNLPLYIVGEGPEKINLKNSANDNIKFIKNNTDSNIAKLMSKCRAFVYAGIEDFGITPVEAMASGAPVIALKRGGILDTINCLNDSNKKKVPTGILFNQQTSSDVFDTVQWFENKKLWERFNSQDINHYSNKFSNERFQSEFKNFINKSSELFRNKLS